MPKYSITNAQFSPFSFGEMVRPYQLATEKYEKQVDTFNKMVEDVDAVDYLAQSLPDDSPYKQQFNNFMREFNAAGDNLSQGWSPDTASKLTNLRRMYHNTLVPLQKADIARTKMVETQNAMRAKDPTLRFEVDASDQNSLQYFLDNPGTAAIKSYSMEDILRTAAGQIKNLKEEAYRRNAFDALGEEGKLLAQNTLSDADVQKVVSNPEMYPNISAVINTAINSSGLENWSDEGKERELGNAWSTALSGISAGLSTAVDSNIIPADKQIEYGLKQRQLDIQALRAARSGRHGSNTAGNPSYDEVVHKGDRRTLTQGRKSGIFEPRDFPPSTNTGKKVKTDGTIITKRETSTKPNGKWISIDDLLRDYCDENTFAGQKILETIANETRGYLDAFAYYITPENQDGVRTITIMQLPDKDMNVGSYYDYSEEGFDKNYTSEFANQVDWDAAQKKKARQERKEAKKAKRKTPQQAVDSTGVVKPKTERASDNTL